jgi:non-heme chloroperoxidase
MTKTNRGSRGPVATIAEYEAEQVKRANSTGRQPIVFVHGLWLLPSSWDRWAKLFEEAGYTALTPGWPDDPEAVEEAKQHPEVFAGKTIGQIADHYDRIIHSLDQKPAILGHSFGGLLVQILAGRGLASATVAIDPAPFRGVLPLPISALKSARPVPAPEWYPVHDGGRRRRCSVRRGPTPSPPRSVIARAPTARPEIRRAGSALRPARRRRHAY